MRLERLTANKIKIFLTFDDLNDRGLTKEDIWKDSGKWNQLFHDMLEEACEEFDVEIQGHVAVEIFSLQVQGLIMIITVDDDVQEEEGNLDEGFIEMQVRVGDCDKLLYRFQDFEDIIQLAKRLSFIGVAGGSLYTINNCYYLLMDNMKEEKKEAAACILSEYGNASILSPIVLAEYGKLIIENKAVETILEFFS